MMDAKAWLARHGVEDRAAIKAMADLPFRETVARQHHYLVRDGDALKECCFLTAGHAIRTTNLPDGARQIISINVPGDAVGLQHLLLDRADHNIQMVTDGSVSWIDRDRLKRALADHPVLAVALWRLSSIEAAIFRQAVVNVGRRDARTRIAHFICEFGLRCEHAGLDARDDFLMPLSQEQIGDAVGLTAVHVNRMLRQIGEMGLIDRSARRIQVPDWQKLCRFGYFNDKYLHSS